MPHLELSPPSLILGPLVSMRFLLHSIVLLCWVPCPMLLWDFSSFKHTIVKMNDLTERKSWVVLAFLLNSQSLFSFPVISRVVPGLA